MEERYSEKLLEAVRQLLKSDAPYLSSLDSDGETMSIIQNNAYVALDNPENRIPEDDLFMELESRIQNIERNSLHCDLVSAKDTAFYAAALLAVSIGSMFSEGVPFIGLLLGGGFLINGVFSVVSKRKQFKSVEQNYRDLRRALGIAPATLHERRLF